MVIMYIGTPPKALHCAGKGPLYLQHEGHSRTIIGIEKVFRASGQPPAVAFLILDPSTRTGPLDRALRERKGWQVRLQPHLHVLRAHVSRLVLIDQPKALTSLLWGTMLPVPLTITHNSQSPPQEIPCATASTIKSS